MGYTNKQIVAIASDGVELPVEALDQTFVNNTDGTLNYIQVTYNSNVYRQTYTYTSGALTGISKWVKQ